MRMPTSSSVILATLASSASFSLVSAAPTDSQDSAAVAQAPGSDAAPSAPDAGSLGNIFGGLGRREADVEPRQLASLVDTVAGLAPVVDAVLGILGIQRKDAMSTASVLPQDQIQQIQNLVQQATDGLPISSPISPPGLPVPAPGGGNNGGAGNSTNGTSTGDAQRNNGTAANTKAPRGDPPAWVDERRNGNAGSANGASAQSFALPVQMNAIPAGAPFGAISNPAGAVSPGAPAAGNNGSNGNNNASAPSGVQSPSPFSPGLPPNPPNTPAQAMSSPPLFNGPAGAGNTASSASGTATSTASGEPYYPTESA